MPTKSDARQYGGVTKVRTKRLEDGTVLRITFYKKPVKSKSSLAQKVKVRSTTKRPS